MDVTWIPLGYDQWPFQEPRKIGGIYHIEGLCKGYVYGIYPKIWLYLVQCLQFRYLKWPLTTWEFDQSTDWISCGCEENVLGFSLDISTTDDPRLHQITFFMGRFCAMGWSMILFKPWDLCHKCSCDVPPSLEIFFEIWQKLHWFHRKPIHRSDWDLAGANALLHLRAEPTNLFSP